MGQLITALGFVAIIIWGAGELLNTNMFAAIFNLLF